MFGLPLPLVLLARSPSSVPAMATTVKPWFRKYESQVKTDYAYHHTKHVVTQQTERYEGGVHLFL